MSFLTKQQKQNKIVTMTKEHFYFFDFVDFFQKILMLKLAQKMHFEFEKFKINSIELWQFSAGTEFEQIISKKYARYCNDDFIFFLNWISYRSDKLVYLNRVVKINFDYRNNITQTKQKKI